MLSRKDYKEEAEKINKWVQSYFDQMESLPVKSQVSPREVFNSFDPNAPQEADSTENILLEISEKIIPGITHWQHPHFHAYFTANSSVESVLAETVTAAISAQCMLWATSPAAAELEEKVLQWLWREMGFLENWEGVIHDTASTATFTAILTAREKVTGFKSNVIGVPSGLRVYCSTQTHSSIEKAVAMAGIGTQNLIKIEVDKHQALKADELRKAIINDLKEGYKPCCIVSALGTTGTVAIDPLDEISLLCKEFNLWHHVDAAYAGTALLLPEFNGYRDAIQQADSFVFNPHKWLFTNFDCTAYYVKDPEALLKTCTINPEYLRTKEEQFVNNYKDWGVQLGRRFRALKLWWVIKSYGMKGIREKLRNHLRFSDLFVKLMKSNPEFIFPTDPILNFCTLRWIPHPSYSNDKLNEYNQMLLESINDSGKAYLSHTVVNGQYVIRIVLGQTYLEEKHVYELVEILNEQISSLKEKVIIHN